MKKLPRKSEMLNSVQHRLQHEKEKNPVNPVEKDRRMKTQKKTDSGNKKIILGVTGSIAAYKALELVRLFKKEGYDVWVVMTENAKHFITPLSFETLSNNPVFSEMFYEKETSPVHIDLSRDATAIVIAPATANIIAKAATGIADDLLSTIILCATAKAYGDTRYRSQPVLFVPAMNYQMWESAVTQRNISYLKSLGIDFVEPETGPLACEEIGKGRFAPIESIYQELKTALNKPESGIQNMNLNYRKPESGIQNMNLNYRKKDSLKNKKIVITAGRTEEEIDPIRVLTNRSSGRMGIELAWAAKLLGATVKLIGGNLSLSAPVGIDIRNVRTTQQMLSAVNFELDSADALVMAAAVSDFKPTKSYSNKQKQDKLILECTRTPDILKDISLKKHKAYVVGFSLDTHNNINEAKRKLKEKKLDLIIANPVETLDSDRIQPTLIYAKPKGMKIEKLAMQSKKSFAEKLMEIISKEIQKQDARDKKQEATERSKKQEARSKTSLPLASCLLPLASCLY